MNTVFKWMNLINTTVGYSHYRYRQKESANNILTDCKLNCGDYGHETTLNKAK